ncbi:endo-1,4-beta-xylanase [Anaerocolumna cellulosilytica]|uniref:Endo-1,4-beta-xylanase n=1 Tax=Anaerocolumna cellulosilytica TaxID=433286 RepID=A0A6S6R416_9FIRM|nr:glycoside hydrolase family 43 protein [Anaerocolumna cellulosilytica]MBB5194831.1 hypothetical protein [Anaerocolumna cellulosilytica]BCJ94205.1 endo-1,4-beta-xylanase [Anaerocolumna cellulosilytica]
MKITRRNPVVQTIYTSDPAPMVYKDTLYLYTGHDEDNSTWFTMNDWRCFSTKDMVNWTDHGSPLAYTDFSWARGDAWAGQCIERNDIFYYYVPMNKKGGQMAVGVAVSDSPTGPFHDPLGHPLVETETGDIDPTVYIDEDGQAYLYWGNPHLWYVKLNEDMISYDEKVGIVKVPLTEEGFGKRTGDSDRATLYEEGPWFYKRNGLYYMVYAASGIPENIAYSTSTSPTGPWTYRGIIMPTEGGSFTNHPGIIDFKGNSYFFYHNGALAGGGGFTRSVCVEQFQYNADGTFPMLHMTEEGVTPVGTINPYIRNEAETIAWEQGIKTEPCTQGGMNICHIDDGDFIKISNVDFGTYGPKSFRACVSCSSNGGTMKIHMDSLDGILLGEITATNTGSFNNWVMVETNVKNVTGIHDLYFTFHGDLTGNLFKVDYWNFQ